MWHFPRERAIYKGRVITSVQLIDLLIARLV